MTPSELAQYYIALKSPFRLPMFYDDQSILRFVSKSTPLRTKTYTPPRLMSISGADIDMAGRTVELRYEAKNALDALARDFAAYFGTKLVVISGYRSADYQQRMWDLGKCTDSLCAPPGHSEHQLGLAIDVFDASTESEYYKNPLYVAYIKWFRNNAYKYGWTQSYQYGEKIDEYEIEPWHWRYVGIDMATRLHNLGWSYTQYVRFQEAIAK